MSPVFPTYAADIIHDIFLCRRDILVIYVEISHPKSRHFFSIWDKCRHVGHVATCLKTCATKLSAGAMSDGMATLFTVMANSNPPPGPRRSVRQRSPPPWWRPLRLWQPPSPSPFLLQLLQYHNTRRRRFKISN